VRGNVKSTFYFALEAGPLLWPRGQPLHPAQLPPQPQNEPSFFRLTILRIARNTPKANSARSA
jgi:hypothetical protein